MQAKLDTPPDANQGMMELFLVLLVTSRTRPGRSPNGSPRNTRLAEELTARHDAQACRGHMATA